MQAEIYILGKSRVPPWAGNVMTQVEYDALGNITRARVQTSSGMKILREGSVLLRVNGNVAVLSKQDARKYGIL